MLVRPDGYVGARFRLFPKILKVLCMKPFTRSFLSEAGPLAPRKSLPLWKNEFTTKVARP